MNAYRDAPWAKGMFPVVLYFGGLNAPINSNVILAEYLVSHGYVVASISLLGPSDEQTFQSRTADDLEASVRDMEFAWSLLQTSPNIDKTKLGMMGHSVGAIEATILGLRNADASAVIALDGRYGFQGLASVLTHSYGYASQKMRAAFLDLRRAQGAQGNEPLDLSAIESFRHSDRTFITIEKMHHSDFTSFAMVGAQFHTPLPTNYPLGGSRGTGEKIESTSIPMFVAWREQAPGLQDFALYDAEGALSGGGTEWYFVGPGINLTGSDRPERLTSIQFPQATSGYSAHRWRSAEGSRPNRIYPMGQEWR